MLPGGVFEFRRVRIAGRRGLGLTAPPCLVSCLLLSVASVWAQRRGLSFIPPVSAWIVRAVTIMPNQPFNGGNRHVTRDVEVATLADLLKRPPRATVAFIDRDEVQVLPVQYRLHGDAHWIGVAGDVAAGLDSAKVVLVIDDGTYWYELRGISVRGVAERNDPADADAECVWYTIAARRILAWDYGTIREA